MFQMATTHAQAIDIGLNCKTLRTFGKFCEMLQFRERFGTVFVLEKPVSKKTTMRTTMMNVFSLTV